MSDSSAGRLPRMEEEDMAVICFVVGQSGGQEGIDWLDFGSKFC